MMPALRESSRSTARSEELLQRLTAIAFAIDGTGTVVAWNGSAERFLGTSATQVLGKPLNDVHVPWSDTRVKSAILTVLTSEETVRLDEIKYVRPDGEQGLLGFTASHVKDDERDESFVFVLGRDITEHRLREHKLQQAQKLEAIGQLAAGMAHEINTPAQYVADNLSFLDESFQELSSVLASMEAATAHGMPEGAQLGELARAVSAIDVAFLREEIPRAIAQAQGGIRQVAKIVSAMRCFSEPARLDRHAADLNRAIEDITTIASNEWRNDATLTLALDASLPPVLCFLSDLSQALLNVVINASQAIKQRRHDNRVAFGNIVVGTRLDDDDVLIWVSDDGCGIPESIRDRIFDPFFTTKPVGKGAGQGLSFARAVVVERHHGAIDVESDVALGTTVTLRIPLNGQ